MADSAIVRRLDARLIEDGILDPAFEEDYSLVHQKLNDEIHKSGRSAQPEETFSLGEKILRDWLHGLARQGASQEKLTSYLRCGWLTFPMILSNPRTKVWRRATSMN
nr:hypothetical protein [Leptospira ellisii]